MILFKIKITSLGKYTMKSIRMESYTIPSAKVFDSVQCFEM